MARMIILRIIEKILTYRAHRAVRAGNQAWFTEQQAMLRDRRGRSKAGESSRAPSVMHIIWVLLLSLTYVCYPASSH